MSTPNILMSFEDFVDERSLISHDALGTKEIKIKLLEVEDDASDHVWRFGIRVKEKEMKEKRHYSSTNRWVQTTDIKNGYILSTRHSSLLADAVALDYIVI